MNDLDSSRHTIICMYIIIMSIFSDTHTMVFKHPVRWMLTSCGANCITMQPRSQQRGCGKLKSEHWIWGFRVFQFNPPLFDFFVWVRKVRVYVYFFFYIIYFCLFLWYQLSPNTNWTDRDAACPEEHTDIHWPLISIYMCQDTCCSESFWAGPPCQLHRRSLPPIGYVLGHDHQEEIPRSVAHRASTPQLFEPESSPSGAVSLNSGICCMT